MSVVRTILKLVIAGILIVLAYVGFTVWNVWSEAQNNEVAEVDAIVVLGAAQYNGTPSPVLQARLDHAAELWKQGYAPTIVVTGGRQPGDTNSEGGASAAYLGRLGIPDTNILREVQGRTSWESLQAATQFMNDRGIHSVILVSDPFHNARIKAMASDLGLEARVSPTQTSPLGGEAARSHYVKEVIGLGVGRIVGFSRVAGLEDDFAARARGL
jgi:uncharacterized SAM-binding protein YcdF (DUF218 family)